VMCSLSNVGPSTLRRHYAFFPLSLQTDLLQSEQS